MAKRRFIQSRTPPYDFYEVTEDYVVGPRVNTDAVLWNDKHYHGTKALDGVDISSRAKHQEYMKKNNLTTIDDFAGTWAAVEKKRDAYRTGQGRGAVTREDIGRAIHALESIK